MVDDSEKGPLVAMFKLADPNQLCYIISWDFYFYNTPKILISDGNFMYFFLTNTIGYSRPLVIGFKVPLVCTSWVYCEKTPLNIITSCRKTNPSFSVPVVRLKFDDVFQNADINPDYLQFWSYIIKVETADHFYELCRKCLLLKPPADSPYLIGIIKKSMYILEYDPTTLNILDPDNPQRIVNVDELTFLKFI